MLGCIVPTHSHMVAGGSQVWMDLRMHSATLSHFCIEEEFLFDRFLGNFCREEEEDEEAAEAEMSHFYSWQTGSILCIQQNNNRNSMSK